MSSEGESRKLCDLRVVDLRSELEKRGLDKAGNKQALLERLQKALEEEGLNPETYQFDSEKKPAKRLSTSSAQPEGDGNQKDHPSDVTEEEDLLENSDNIEVIDVLEEEDHDASKKEGKGAEKIKSSEPKADEQLSESAKLVGEKDKTSEESKKEEKGVNVKQAESKGDSNVPAEPESPIRLTLEEEEAFQDEEESVAETNKSTVTTEKQEITDKKNTTNKNQELAAKELPDNTEKAQDNKKQEGNATSVGASNNKMASKFKKSNSQNRNLWITNISQTTRATELKQALSAYGKVIGAKVVINAKYPGACCYGYVTMDTVEDADNCIAKLNNTELNGQIIRIEKVRPDHMNSVKLNPKLKQPENNKDDKGKPKTPSVHKPTHISKSQERKEDKKDGVKEGDKDKEKKDDKRDDKKDGKDDGHKSDTSSGRRHDLRRRSRSHDRIRDRSRRRSDSRGHRPRPHDRDVLTFDKIKEERERQRLRERDRIVREENRRRREEAARQREVERMQRSEAARLDREREKLRLEREKLEREKAEIIRLERERQKLEREKLELEKLELQRVKMRLQEEDRRAVKRSAPYRREGSYEDRKRMTNDRRYEESPPPPRFDPSRMSKDARYGERDRERNSPHYRPVRDERDRRPMPDHKGDVRATREHRYAEPSKDAQRFDRNAGGGNTWNHPAASSNKVFNTGGSGAPPKAWSKETWRPAENSNNAERWNSGGVSRGTSSLSTTAFSGNSNMNLGPSCPPPPAINNYAGDRFDYKSMNIRKY